MSEHELKCCPFCGSEDICIDPVEGATARVYTAWCNNCQAEGPVDDSETEACDGWNMRHALKGVS